MFGLPVALLTLCKMYFSSAVEVFQQNAVVTAQLGQDVTLSCAPPNVSFNNIAWFRHMTGEKPEFILATYKSSDDYAFYENQSNKMRRFTFQKVNNMYNLHICKIKRADVGTYYCTFYGHLLNIRFGAATLLIVKGAEFERSEVVQEAVQEAAQPGDSVSLQCTIDSETCAGGHRVYWVRHGPGESLPAVIYTHGNRSDECERSPEAGSPTQSCVYQLPKRNISRSDAATYYCAVVSCGHILFGNGTRLEIDHVALQSVMRVLWYAVVSLSAALLLCFIVIVAVICTRNKSCCKTHNADISKPDDGKGSRAREPASQNSNEEMLNYAALSFAAKRPKHEHAKRMLRQEDVYAHVRCSQQH